MLMWIKVPMTETKIYISRERQTDRDRERERSMKILLLLPHRVRKCVCSFQFFSALASWNTLSNSSWFGATKITWRGCLCNPSAIPCTTSLKWSVSERKRSISQQLCHWLSERKRLISHQLCHWLNSSKEKQWEQPRVFLGRCFTQ